MPPLKRRGASNGGERGREKELSRKSKKQRPGLIRNSNKEESRSKDLPLRKGLETVSSRIKQEEEEKGSWNGVLLEMFMRAQVELLPWGGDPGVKNLICNQTIVKQGDAGRMRRARLKAKLIDHK